MSTYNINLWFAKDESGEIVTIDKIKNEYKNKYYCPLCGSEVIPKAVDSDKVSPHFAHIDRSKCSGESIVHYWVKNELIKRDDIIEVITNETKQVMIKDIEFEKSHETPYGVYKPDISLTTYKDEIIFVEVNYTNKKKVEDYYLKWKYLRNTVIEFGIKNVYSEEDNKIIISNSFKSIYYEGMIFNIDKNENKYVSYRNNIVNKISKNNIKKLKEIEWFIDDIYKYNIGVIDICDLTVKFDSFKKDFWHKELLVKLFKNSKCSKAMSDIINYKDNVFKNIEADVILKYGDLNIGICERKGKQRLIHDRLFSSYSVPIKTQYVYELIKNRYSKFKSNNFDSEYYIHVNIDDFGINYLQKFYDNIDKIIEQYVYKSKICLTLKNVINMNEINSYNIFAKISYIEVKSKWNGVFKIYNNGMISYNDLNICKTDMNDEKSIYRDFQFTINYVIPDACCIFSKNIIDLYEKILKRYTIEVNGDYKIKIDNRKIYLYDNDIISEYEYNDNTTFSDIVEVFSKSIRRHLYL